MFTFRNRKFLIIGDDLSETLGRPLAQKLVFMNANSVDRLGTQGWTPALWVRDKSTYLQSQLASLGVTDVVLLFNNLGDEHIQQLKELAGARNARVYTFDALENVDSAIEKMGIAESGYGWLWFTLAGVALMSTTFYLGQRGYGKTAIRRRRRR